MFWKCQAVDICIAVLVFYSALTSATGKLLTCSREHCPVVDSQELQVLEKIKEWLPGVDDSVVFGAPISRFHMGENCSARTDLLPDPVKSCSFDYQGLLTQEEFSCLYCCPSCVSDLASSLFFLEPDPTYLLSTREDGSHEVLFTDKAEWQYTDGERENITALYTTTSLGSQLACMFFKSPTTSDCNILYSHGNAVDLGQMASFYVGLGRRLQCNIFSYDYSGYGASSGQPSEDNLYADMEAAWQAMVSSQGVPQEEIILFGESLGTAPTTDLASKHKFRGFILQGGLASAMRVVFPRLTDTLSWDVFNTIEKISRVSAPTLIIHGTQDEIIGLHHGQALYRHAANPVEPLWVQGAGHSDVPLYTEYLVRLKTFVNESRTSVKNHAK